MAEWVPKRGLDTDPKDKYVLLYVTRDEFDKLDDSDTMWHNDWVRQLDLGKGFEKKRNKKK